MRLALEYLGHEVVGFAADGHEAIEKYGSMHPDLIVMDVRMPRMDGLTCTSLLSKADPSAKVVVVTGSRTTESEAREAGARGFLEKPFDVTDSRSRHPLRVGRRLAEKPFSTCHTTHPCGIAVPVQEPLTPPQQKLLTYILDSIRKGGRPPTVREICHAFGYRSTGTARDHLRALETKGHLRRLPGKARGLVPHNWPNILRAEFPPMPILGRVPAGGPLLAEENIEGTLDLSEEFAGQKVFALKVHGDSMIEAGICEDDLVVVRGQNHAEPVRSSSPSSMASPPSNNSPAATGNSGSSPPTPATSPSPSKATPKCSAKSSASSAATNANSETDPRSADNPRGRPNTPPDSARRTINGSANPKTKPIFGKRSQLIKCRSWTFNILSLKPIHNLQNSKKLASFCRITYFGAPPSHDSFPINHLSLSPISKITSPDPSTPPQLRPEKNIAPPIVGLAPFTCLTAQS